jgi:type I restriction enzyme S subunit
MRGNWAKTGLGEMVEVLDRMRRPISSAERTKRLGGVPYYGATGQTGWINESIFNEELVLLGEDAIDFLNPLARKAYLISGPSWVNNHVHVLRPIEGKTRPYFLTELLNMVDYSQFVSFGTRSKLTQGAMMDISVRLPPLVDQDRIVDILVSVDTYIAALEQQAVDAQSARNAVLHELLTAGGDDWIETTLGELVNIQKGKKPPLLGDNTTTGQPYLTADVLRGSAPSQFVPQSALAACAQLQGNETILLWDGAGAGDVFRATAGVLASTMAKLAIKQRGLIRADYLYLVVVDASPEIKSSCRGTTVPHVSPGALTALSLTLPPLSEQQRIVGIVSAMDGIVSATEQAVTDAQRLRSSLRSDLLSGDHEIPETYDRLLGAA